ncbi:glycoside hydrolase family 88 protein [Polaribacter haliotis]|uniref:Glycoside hydrolase family 88 protein n=1 Tax=Polaribacter haliotis TaxID=1888915 RepID=A0A7L8AFU7_9FLAO|nr:glycoside hydrolase family 88 protein [Polaribacter haliotis]QOD60689.1 glycoside hydrolase family 88 protein [Polaribacter haliotis]
MKKTKLVLIASFVLILLNSCKEDSIAKKSILEKIETQYSQLYDSATTKFDDNLFLPKTIKDNKLRLVSSYEWTSGFYPGSLWYLYELTKDSKWKDRALAYTKKLDTIQYWEGNHDVGFIIECSYGNAIKDTPSKDFDKIIVQTAKSLSTRFRPRAGIIQSWKKSSKWDCPVIIDNMMNLELLFHATKISGDSTYYNIAVSHADTTIKNHFRKDYSTYHVLDYDRETGGIVAKKTAQGYSDESAWARGQAWGLYGYTVCYRETKYPKYLEQAIKIADYLINHKNLPNDKIPYWDYDVPVEKDTPRDASAASITASALYELGHFTKDNKQLYLSFADEIMKSLNSPDYFAEEGTNKGFLLKHSVGSIPHGVEIDVPLNYADYYYLEALYRSKNLK